MTDHESATGGAISENITTRWLKEKAEVLWAGQEMARRGLVVGSSGNVSLKVEEGLIAITPHGAYYDELIAEDIVVINAAGEAQEGQRVPSAESLLHSAIYKARPDVKAIIHTHSLFASALAVAGKEIPPILDDQMTYLGGDIKLAPYALPGTADLIPAVAAALGKKNAVLIANHGALGVGGSLKHALTNCLMLEKVAQVYVFASSLGRINQLSPQAEEALKVYFTMLQDSK
ncbi:MAG: class II aldolase/adducin family protein [Chloroflexota bacterium]